MTFPTGPADVGFEPVVLPVSVTPHYGSACLVVAPTCRCGIALYRPVAVWAAGELAGDEEDLAESGKWCMCLLPTGQPVLRVELRMFCFYAGSATFIDLPSDELARVLHHPLASIREAAFMALGR